MLLPDNFKDVIANNFYDKTVEILQKTETLDNEGGVIKEGTTVASTFTANVQFTANDEFKTDLGLIKDIDIAISCSTDTTVEVDDLLQYEGIKYIAINVLKYDSHKLIVGKKWQ